ncbi:MAG: ATP:cob(I)alamin adenosyltransferase [Phycisphaerae bacterium]|nr:ATP:cob(I)alamin adenosyltransferase [Phycisphaerae bacterium]
MKLYTRTGDDGTTGLIGGDRVDKDNERIEAYGTVDELNACLGLACCCLGTGSFSDHAGRILSSIQSRLFDMGAELATVKGSDDQSVQRIDGDMVRQLEKDIDLMSSMAPPIRNFVIPGGCELAARLHLARTVCRRGERLLIGLVRQEQASLEVLKFLNRLSDLLFAMARAANADAGIEDVPWIAHAP